MTPTQLRSFVTVVRLGSVRAAAGELGVTEAAVSGNVGALRRELDDSLFRRSRDGLVFTPGGLRLAHRAVEILGLAEQTRREVVDASEGRRLLRVAATSLFAEYAAPGLIELFSQRADDLDVELLVESSSRFPELLMSHGVDVAIGPQSSRQAPYGIVSHEFLRYDVIAVASSSLASNDLSEQTWYLGPSAVEPLGVSQYLLERAGIPDDMQRIFTSHSAAIERARNGEGIALAPKFAVGEALRDGTLIEVDELGTSATGIWAAQSLPTDRSTLVARELCRFVSTPRAIQAMLKGSGAGIGHFKPQVHITLWS